MMCDICEKEPVFGVVMVDDNMYEVCDECFEAFERRYRQAGGPPTDG